MDASDTRETVKVQPWGEGQGEFVEIDAEDFDEAVHKMLDPLDHDGDGAPGGSLKGEQSTAAKGAAKRRARAK
jgi:hypothetical protein